jgi:DNA-directed RNA polymerase specialized sigma24 family protein
MKSSENPSKKIYDRDSRQWIDVTEEQYRDYMRDTDRTRKKMQGRKECNLERSKFWLCDGCCVGCPYRMKGRMTSMDEQLGAEESGEDFTLHDVIGDPKSAFEDQTVDRIYYRQIINRLMDLYPEAIEIGELRMQGKNDSEIAEIIGVKRTTFRSRLEKAKKQIYEEMGGDIFS